tara:strand:- start:43302 stop:44621 length:1320 start_codon:yes stop_codon:yes gene_type:complete
MSKKRTANQAKTQLAGYEYIKTVSGIEEYRLRRNGLRVLFYNRPETGVVTSNITYLVGARDEARGETGVAHMLEHMLFKPTNFDRARGLTDSWSMNFERNTGSVLNANTWKDRTTYYFSYPTDMLDEALQIEAERMTGVILNDKELNPERGNVLSEFDMYNGDPDFALSVQMVSTAYHSHPYGHETIGYREDIEDYTPAKLEKFYRDYYRPDNAVMMVVGDIDRDTALKAVKKHFSGISSPKTAIPRFSIREPKQEGLRRVTITRPSTTNLLAIGFKHSGFPSQEWFATTIMLDVLTGGAESLLHKLLVDTGKASSVSGAIEPTSEENLGMISINLAKGQEHEEIESLVLHAISALDKSTIDNLIKKSKEQILTQELFSRQHSLKICQELTEYVASGHWERYEETPNILKQISTKQILQLLSKLFVESNLTIGYFKGNN